VTCQQLHHLLNFCENHCRNFLNTRLRDKRELLEYRHNDGRAYCKDVNELTRVIPLFADRLYDFLSLSVSLSLSLSPMPPHVLIVFVVSPPGCGRSVTDFWGWGAVTLPRCCEWLYIWAWNTRKGLKPKFYTLPRPWSPWGSFPARENSYGRTGNLTRDLMLSSQKVWPPSHDAGPIVWILYGRFILSAAEWLRFVEMGALNNLRYFGVWMKLRPYVPLIVGFGRKSI
jgi:hypothetical protein